MEKGDFCLLPPGTKHIIGVFSDDTLVINVVFTPEFFREEVLPDLSFCFKNDAAALSDNVKYMILHTDFSETEAAEAEALYYMLDTAGNNSLCCLFRSLILLITHSPNTRAESEKCFSHRKAPNSLEITNFIQSNIRTVNISDMSEYFCYSPEYMKKLIKKQTGATFRQLVRILRTELVMYYRILDENHLTNYELADYCGYSSISGMKRDLKAMNINI